MKGLYSASHHGRRSSSEDEEEDKVEAVPIRSGFSSHFPKVGMLSREEITVDCLYICVIHSKNNYCLVPRVVTVEGILQLGMQTLTERWKQ